MIPSVDRVRDLLSYDPLTGIFRWRRSVNSRSPKGSIAGGPDRYGYRRIKIGGRYYRAHRLAWLLMTGGWPISGIDHRDGDPSNQTWTNLRAADVTQNAQNQKRRIDNKQSLKGVGKDRRHGRYFARITVNGKTWRIGTFATAEEAHEAYLTEAKKYFGDFARAS